jgi:hypothetical protein
MKSINIFGVDLAITDNIVIYKSRVSPAICWRESF